ncbi:hypothetical protein EST38_g7013 [Candolleomyces aberdarensis]|uniref:Nephrocystin 3-like N-terminal domain-containing protein n=1 Tax=Candolleomyces aberdarensis TaxID=2316362 RepID=A0A4Q2DI88_9AGAR|nr:hypothetical protein EST38_g7013 [Candolleomyces aberdarensis]
MANNILEGARDFQVDKLKINVTNVSSSSWGVGPLKELESRIAAGAIHDSAERCDAPKCHPETRVAVQDDLYGWIIDRDGDSEHPKKIKWVTGPAGTGKTAVMGSLSERCKAAGVLVATFFFASWSASIGRRRKTAFVATLAHQLSRYHPNLREEISKAVDANSDVFDKNLHVQMEVLVLGPLQEITGCPDGSDIRGAIIIDGLDECEAEQYHDTAIPGLGSNCPLPRSSDQDQLEILKVLQTAALHPSFPFRILIASRPEQVFREFFDPQNNPTPFSHKLDLHEDYKVDADITLFLEAQFNRIRRRYNLPLSWPPIEAIQTLVRNASGQFIYAATVIRYVAKSPKAHPDDQLQSILEMTPTTTSNPFEILDSLYSHILESSPDAALSVRWIRGIRSYIGSTESAYHVNLLLETKPGEAEYLLGSLHSLIRIPPRNAQATTKYDLYHKSLNDYLDDRDRCGRLYIQFDELIDFLWDRFNRACAIKI